MSTQSQAHRQRLTAQTLERMREGIRKRAETLSRDHEQRFAAVGRMVAEHRLERGMSQQELAVLCGTTQSAIARLERGGRPPKLDTLMRIADALDAELRLVQPRVIICLGATAAQSLLGKAFRVTKRRGQKVSAPFANAVFATVHPSSVLRAPDPRAREDARRAFVADLRKVARYLGRLEREVPQRASSRAD